MRGHGPGTLGTQCWKVSTKAGQARRWENPCTRNTFAKRLNAHEISLAFFQGGGEVSPSHRVRAAAFASCFRLGTMIVPDSLAAFSCVTLSRHGCGIISRPGAQVATPLGIPMRLEGATVVRVVSMQILPAGVS
jgi:hypothetical protein